MLQGVRRVTADIENSAVSTAGRTAVFNPFVMTDLATSHAFYA